jgi:PEP-CTERM motif
MTPRSFLLSSLAAGVLFSAAAVAGPIQTTVIDGITVPYSSDIFMIQSDKETYISAPGQSFQGAGLVQSIEDNISGTYTYNLPCGTVGCSGTFLTDVFSGLTVRAITTVGSGTSTVTTVFLTGGQITYYVHNTLPMVSSNTISTDITNSMSSKVFLQLTPEVLDSNNDTFIITIPGTLASFRGDASGNALLDVTGGDAAWFYNTNTFLNTYNGLYADIGFVGDAHLIIVNGKPVAAGGSDDTHASHIPEPSSLAILATALLGVGWFTGRRKVAKQT